MFRMGLACRIGGGMGLDMDTQGTAKSRYGRMIGVREGLGDGIGYGGSGVSRLASGDGSYGLGWVGGGRPKPNCACRIQVIGWEMDCGCCIVPALIHCHIVKTNHKISFLPHHQMSFLPLFINGRGWATHLAQPPGR